MPFTFESVDEWLDSPGSLAAAGMDAEEADLRAALGLPQ